MNHIKSDEEINFMAKQLADSIDFIIKENDFNTAEEQRKHQDLLQELAKFLGKSYL